MSAIVYIGKVIFAPWWLSLAVVVWAGAEIFGRMFPMIYHIPLEKFSAVYSPIRKRLVIGFCGRLVK